MMSGPVRVQLSRRKGWRMPPNTVKVDRSTKWGNPSVVTFDERRPSGEDDDTMVGPWLCHLDGDHRPQLAGFWFDTKVEAITKAISVFRWRMTDSPTAGDRARRAALGELRGKNLACWCKPGDPCHADVLLELANPSTDTALTENRKGGE